MDPECGAVGPRPRLEQSMSQSWVTRPQPPERREIDLEAHATRQYSTAGTDPQIGQRRESALTAAFHAHLRAMGHDLCRLKIQPLGELRPLFTDTYDRTTNTLYEAKSSATRRSVRQLIGQLIDYRCHIQQPALRVCALLPTEPSADLLALIHSIGASCTWPSSAGQWTLAEPS